MKKTLLFLFTLLLLVANIYADERLEIKETDDAYYIHYYITGLDSADTFTSNAFPSASAIAWYLSGYTNGITVSVTDTTAVAISPSFTNDVYATVIVNGTGSVDSASYIYIKGLNADGTWSVYDTLATTKATPHANAINFDNLMTCWEWRFNGAIADLTVSAYSVRVDISIIIPKRRV